MTDRYAVRLFEQLLHSQALGHRLTAAAGRWELGAIGLIRASRLKAVAGVWTQSPTSQSSTPSCPIFRRGILGGSCLLLNLTQDPDGARAVRAGLCARRRSPADPDDFHGRRAGVARRSTSSRTRSTFASSARVQTTLELPCSRCLEPFTRAGRRRRSTCAISRTRPNTGEGEREIEDDDLTTAFYENDDDRPRPADARAVLSGAADEAAVPRRLPGAVPAVRHEPEPRDLRLHARLGRSAARRAEGAENDSRRLTRAAQPDSVEMQTSRENNDAESKTTTFQDADGQAPDARRAEAGRPQRVPAVPRAEAAAPRVRELRLLPRPPGARRSRRVDRAA